MERFINKRSDEAYSLLSGDPSVLPFSFRYRGREYSGLGGEGFDQIGHRRHEKENWTDDIYDYSLSGELTVSLKLTHYPKYGVTEWTVWFINKSDADTGIISDAKTTLKFKGGAPVVSGILGDHQNQYRPYEHPLEGDPLTFVSESGRPTHINFPYFNLEYGDEGCMLAIGWAGTWTADFRTENGVTTVTLNSTNGLNTILHPGESIRTALFVTVPYAVRDRDYATNLWREWFIKCSMPKADKEGNDVKPFSASCLSGDTGIPNSDGSISERYFTWYPSLKKIIDEGIDIDFRWFDAGWYTAPDGGSPTSDWWGTVGTWELDKIKWPGKTFLESTDFARAHGMKTLMWFEPERTTDVDSMVRNTGYKREWAIEREGMGGVVNNIGDKDCLAWTTERVCKVLRENKVEMYREDNNFNPAPLWNELDAEEGENRKGITECHVVENHYQMWDDIIECTKSFGGCGFVDSCASGGGRNDLESLRRGIPLLRSDADRTTTSLRLSMSYGFNKWVPFCGALTSDQNEQLSTEGIIDVYSLRASYLPVLNVSSRYRFEKRKERFEILRFGIGEWKKVNPYLLKDFYTHTPWHSEQDRSGFTAFSYIDPDRE
nr:alpha-galactosidase [Clostridiales bacterium]